MDQASEPIPCESEDEAFRTMLLQAGDCDALPSAEHVERVRQALARHLMSMKPAGPRISRRAWGWCGVSVGAAAAAAVAFFQLQPRFVWARVVQAVQERPWIHGTATDSKGGIHEFWLSLPRELSATRHVDFVRYDDWRAGICHEFDPRTKQLIRRCRSATMANSTQDMHVSERFFAAIRMSGFLPDNAFSNEIADRSM